MTPVRVAFGTDEGTPLTDHIREHLASAGHEVVVVGEGRPWPEIGRRVGEEVAAGRVDFRVVCCFTGTGVSIAANKVPGVRAALCTDAATAEGARRWNDANVVAVGLRLTSPVVAGEILDAFFSNVPDDGEAETIGSVE